jgi:hypothetical protein
MEPHRVYRNRGTERILLGRESSFDAEPGVPICPARPPPPAEFPNVRAARDPFQVANVALHSGWGHVQQIGDFCLRPSLSEAPENPCSGDGDPPQSIVGSKPQTLISASHERAGGRRVEDRPRRFNVHRDESTSSCTL